MSTGWSNQRCVESNYSSYKPAKKLRNIGKKKAKAAAAGEGGEEEGREEGKAERFSEGAKTILALAASRESYREGTSEAPQYNDSFYTTVAHAVITAKVVKTDYDFERIKELVKQFYQTNRGRDWRIHLAGLKAQGITQDVALNDHLVPKMRGSAKKRKRVSGE